MNHYLKKKSIISINSPNCIISSSVSAVAKVDKSLRHLHDLELEVLINIFYTQVKPILLYSAEILGMCNDTSVIENVHSMLLNDF